MDALAVSTPHSPAPLLHLSRCRDLLALAVREKMATECAFNATLRCATKSHGDERLRDACLDVGCEVFDGILRYEGLERNGATYMYFMTVIMNAVPESRSKGNILFGLFEKAKREGVLDEKVLEVLQKERGDLGVDYGNWRTHWLDGKNIQDLPWKWKKNAKKRRYHASPIY